MPAKRTTHAIRMNETGGPEVLRWQTVELPSPAPGELLVRHAAIGLNFIDTYQRTGLYPVALPAVLGSEAAGVVEEVGAGVQGFATGDRVAYGSGALGAYAEARNIPAAHVVKVPAGIDEKTAAAAMLKGMTAQYLARRSYVVMKGDVVLVQAAAGGVGSILCQWAKHLGATVIGTVGSEPKAQLARDNGCDHVILYRTEDVAARVRAITNGEGVPVVYDSVGKDTFAASLDCLRPRGLMVSFGQSSGPIGPFDPRLLAQKGSLFLTRPKLGDYVLTRAELEETARDLFEVIASGAVRINVAQTYPLRDAERAHRDLEARKTTGSTLLLP
jgi:NADPH2:quinone reductase